MKSQALRRTRVAAAVGAALLSLTTGQAFGAAFGLQTQNASGLGHAYSGGAAAAEDVSTIFYNPAGLVRLPSTQFVVSANVVCPSIKFHDSGSQPAAFQPLGSTGGDAGGCEVLPNMYLGIPFTDKWSFGLGVNVPFGLMTEYGSDWLGRFQGVKSKLETVNINPVLSWEPTPHLTVGGGVSWQRVKATLTQKVNYAGLFAQGVGGLVAAGQLPGSQCAHSHRLGRGARIQCRCLRRGLQLGLEHRRSLAGQRPDAIRRCVSLEGQVRRQRFGQFHQPDVRLARSASGAAGAGGSVGRGRN